LQWAIIPEIAAAVTKLMSNKDLVLAGRGSATSHAAAIPWESAEYWAFARNPITLPTTSAEF
jgi:hypothetical protein